MTSRATTAKSRLKASASPAASASQEAAPARAFANKHRGEVLFRVGDQDYKLCLTMNALVEIEDAFGIPLSKLGSALAQPSMKQLRTILGALVRGGGADLTDEELGASPFDIVAASKAVEEAFIAAQVLKPGAPSNDDGDDEKN
ncbi:MAG: gene transfer agent family protein [Hyphomonadaceae bacterium]|nr:gene transfer agent family protein [Hyphomonadaceae bacterium]